MEICENGKIKKKYQKLGTKNKKRIIPSKKSVPTVHLQEVPKVHGTYKIKRIISRVQVY